MTGAVAEIVQSVPPGVAGHSVSQPRVLAEKGRTTTIFLEVVAYEARLSGKDQVVEVVPRRHQRDEAGQHGLDGRSPPGFDEPMPQRIDEQIEAGEKAVGVLGLGRQQLPPRPEPMPAVLGGQFVAQVMTRNRASGRSRTS